MLKQPTFSDILSQLSQDNSGKSSTFVGGWESHLDPRCMIELMTCLEQSHFARSPAKAYPQRKRKPQPTPPHSLNDTQRGAYEFLKAFQQGLSEGFNGAELKSAYRCAVLKTHPDRGGNSESFQEVKKSYQILLALVKN